MTVRERAGTHPMTESSLALRLLLPHEVTAGRVSFFPAAGSGETALACLERELWRLVLEEAAAPARGPDPAAVLLRRVREALRATPDAPAAVRKALSILEEGGGP